MSQMAIKIGPADHGRAMTLDDFDRAEGQKSYLYELGRGKVVVMDAPKRVHLAQVNAARRQLFAYWDQHPERINQIAGSGECKLLIGKWQSERHPDLTIYKRPPDDEEDVWATWVPELVIEVVSPRSSETRDYEEKPEEYLDFGVKEYWIIDESREEMLVHQRVAGRWKERVIQPAELYRTRLPPGLEFDCSKVFAAARRAKQA